MQNNDSKFLNINSPIVSVEWLKRIIDEQTLSEKQNNSEKPTFSDKQSSSEKQSVSAKKNNSEKISVSIKIIDTRFNLNETSAGYLNYRQSHLPNALFMDLNADLSDMGKSNLGRHPLPDSGTFTRKLGELGITPVTPIVIYDAGDGSMAAARLWWLMRLLGHTQVAILDGGLTAWRAAGLPETDILPTPIASEPYPAEFNSDEIITTEYIEKNLSQPSGWLWDARANPRFKGEVEPIDPVAGHIPNAINRPFQLSLENGLFKSPKELKDEFSTLLNDYSINDIVVMCGSGVTACHLLLSLEYAGLSGAKVYAGSWSEWINHSQRPIAKG